MSNIKCFAFAKQSSTVPILAYCPQKQNQDEFKIQSGKVLSQLKSLTLRMDERQKFSTANGRWHCKKDSKGILYFVLCNPNYPQRTIIQAINQVKDHLQKLGQYQTQPDSSLKIHAKSTVQQICQKYQDLKSVDPISSTQGHIDEIKTIAIQNTNKMIKNTIQLDNLKQQAQSLKDNSYRFSENATQLQRLMYWRNCKLKIIIGFIIACLLTLIIVPIVVKANKTA